MTSLVVVVLNGWGASSRRRESRTSELVRGITADHVTEGHYLALRAMMGVSRSRRVSRFIRRHQGLDRDLLLVAKSLGARNMVSRVLNGFQSRLIYRRTGLVTIDPCWPLRWDWRPNLNRSVLRLVYPWLDEATNFFAVLPQDKQSGSMVYGQPVVNIPLVGPDHVSITLAPEVRDEVRRVTDWLVGS